MALQYSTNRQFCLPDSAVGVTCDPSTMWADGPWTIVGTPDTDGVLTGIIYRTPTNNDHQNELEIDISVGAGHDVIATFKFNFWAIIGACDHGQRITLPVPIEGILAGEIVSARIRQHTRVGALDTTPWYISIQYLKLPIVGNLQTTAQPMKVYPPAADAIVIGTGGSSNPPWTQGAPVEIVASTATDIALAGIDIWNFNSHEPQDFDLLVDDVVTMTIVRSSGYAQGACTQMIPNPFEISAGSKISAQIRYGETFPYGNNNFYISLMYYELPL